MCLAFLNSVFPSCIAKREYLSIRTFRSSTSRMHSNLFGLFTKEKVKENNWIYQPSWWVIQGENTASDLHRVLQLRNLSKLIVLEGNLVHTCEGLLIFYFSFFLLFLFVPFIFPFVYVFFLPYKICVCVFLDVSVLWLSRNIYQYLLCVSGHFRLGGGQDEVSASWSFYSIGGSKQQTYEQTIKLFLICILWTKQNSNGDGSVCVAVFTSAIGLDPSV